MKRNLLTPAQAAWLAETIERNRAQFAGWSMDASGGDGDGSGSGDGTPGDGGTGSNQGGDTAADGFPANTPVDQMTADQQAAYYRHQARKHEDRNKELLRLTGGKYGDDLKAVFDELENLRDEKRTDGEKAVEEARRTAREEVTREYGPKSVRTAFELLLGDMPEQDRNAEIELLDLSKFLTDSGDVDTAKVRSHAEKIAPADKGQGNQRHDFGAGRRGAGPAKTGLSAGAELYAARKKSSTTVNS